MPTNYAEEPDFEYICGLVRAKSGIVLEAGKEYLVDARLTALARQQKIDSIATLVSRLRANPLDPLHRLMIEAMTTNETSFFRDHHPFDALRGTVLPALLAKNAATRSLNIWCAASSTGQEPYTIAMTLCEAIPKLADWKLTFIATDISAEMVQRSRAGTYNQIEVNRGLPAPLLVKYFERHGLEWQIKPPLRKMIDFREMNLTASWALMPQMDLVFMRNVLIYFDTPTKKSILAKVRQVLKPDGYLFLGCAETTLCLDDAYERTQIEKSGCYRIRPPALSKAA
jgi:chemotaxis protein methyltransferase CheR